MVDIVSNGYQYANASLEFNIIQQCSIVSIISPHAFTIQLNKDSMACDDFLKTMK